MQHFDVKWLRVKSSYNGSTKPAKKRTAYWLPNHADILHLFTTADDPRSKQVPANSMIFKGFSDLLIPIDGLNRGEFAQTTGKLFESTCFDKQPHMFWLITTSSFLVIDALSSSHFHTSSWRYSFAKYLPIDTMSPFKWNGRRQLLSLLLQK